MCKSRRPIGRRLFLMLLFALRALFGPPSKGGLSAIGRLGE